ncbi:MULTISPECIES: ABC transporter ATP-binding protein [unclassified Actinomyces]|uniref:ABC transporter ATP-binding protein n=1 Tax=unclassified Actinomyces TaxID=2609248 RepID=UPI00201742DE|nr:MULTISPECIES: ABC transporter ATP-binding protein [unclassified Actinomyces]MCL3778623.1 ABC transporter ATP-binding protein [Actinomyces sp. AC-20-1]MCL3790892.1 ABC transporter ATP-binding protein [Actinomyces sp. 187325]MCL3793147.1 ABC transporter ATP-binding protein [Actinomyces sp. 186855]
MSPHTASPAVEVTDLTKVFGTGARAVRAVDGLTLTVAPGEIVAFLGPNGAGKTTTLDTLLGLSAPSSGHVRVLGTSPRRAAADGCLGVVLQSGGLIPDYTVAETLRAIASVQGRHATGDLGALAASTGLAPVLGRRVARCSGGELQRLRLALALVADPRLLVLDEPTAGMDVTARTSFWDTMREQAHGGRTILFATHYLEEAAAFADRIVIIARGRLVADGTVDEIRALGEGTVVSATWEGVDEPALAAAIEAGGLADRVLGTALRGEHVEIRTSASDDVARWLLTATPAAHLGISAVSLNEVFTALTEDAGATGTARTTHPTAV